MYLKILDIPPIQLAIISGILVGISYPPIPGFAIWFGFVPLIHIWLNQTKKESARLTFLSAIISNTIAFYWIGLNSGASFIPVFLSLTGAVLYLSFLLAIFGWIISWFEIKRRGIALIIIPFLWVTMEWLRSFGPLGFPWANLAITQTKFLPIIQIIDFTGSEGIGFWIMILNTYIYYLIINNSVNKKIITLFIIFIIPWIYGTLRIDQLNDKEWEFRTVAAIQPNINPNQKWEPTYRKTLISIMDSLNNEAYNMKPKLVLWPEAALPVYMRVSSIKQVYEKKVYESNIPLIMGTVDFKRDKVDRKVFNGSIYFGLNENKIYHKLLLVPFAEYIPLSEKFSFLKQLNFGQANFSHGSEFTIFPIDSIYFSNIICYESSHPSVARGFINNGARFLTIQANDAWLQNSSGVRQHFELARLRAIEFRTGIIRSANTGISGIIDPTGLIKHKVNFSDQEVFKGDVLLNKGLTFYASFGSLFAQLCFVLILFQGAFILIRKK